MYPHPTSFSYKTVKVNVFSSSQPKIKEFIFFFVLSICSKQIAVNMQTNLIQIWSAG